MTTIKNIIHNLNCIEGMKSIADGTVDMVVCDPPYNIGKDFGNDSDKQKMDDYLKFCDEWTQQALRILKPRGTMYIYGFSEILAYIRVRLHCNVRWIIWHYTNKTVPSLKGWQRTHDSILVCSKDKKPIFNRDDVREPYSKTFLKNAAGHTRKATKGRFSNGKTETEYKAHVNGALPRDVLKEFPALAGGAGAKERVDHPTQKPLKLCSHLIKACMNNDLPEGERNLVVVPFVGSGSECVSAKSLGCDFIGYELNPTYITLARQRLDDVEAV